VNEHWDHLLPLVASRPHLYLLTDFDGTIVSIAPRPEETRLSARARAALAALVARPRTRVALVSGRPAATLAEKTGVAGLTLVGNHGLEVVGGAARQEDPRATAARPAIARLSASVRQLIAGLSGVAFEDKEISLSLHTKLVSAAEHERLGRELERRVAAEPQLELGFGKRVFEVRPCGATDKGRATLALLEAAHGAGWARECAAIFLGDDLTDETGFVAVRQHGAGVLVAEAEPERATAARYRARGVDDALALLEALAATPSAAPVNG
jgi:trehalose-phosphatase